MPAMDSVLCMHCGSGFSREFGNPDALFAVEAAPIVVTYRLSLTGLCSRGFIAGMAHSYWIIGENTQYGTLSANAIHLRKLLSKPSQAHCSTGSERSA